MKLLLTAGGQGSKLWPYSRKDKPKQFQQLLGPKSLYSYNVDTLLERFPPEDIYILTKKKFMRYATEQSPSIPEKDYIIEPDIYINRGPSEGLAFVKLSILHPDEPFFLVQVDNLRKPESVYLKMIENCEKIVKRDKKFISGGIKATEPLLGVDYLRLGDRVESSYGEELYLVEEFVPRKKNIKETKKLIEGFHIVIYCNHSCWYPDPMLDAYKEFHPEWYRDLLKMREAMGSRTEDSEIEKIYSQMKPGPTEDVTRHIFNRGYVVLTKFKWIDIGTWASLYDYLSEDGGVHKEGKVIGIDSRGSLIKSVNPGKLVAVAGVDNLVIVDTGNVLLVIHKDKTDKISEIQALLKERGENGYL